jgi:hypothetical protein
MRYFRMKYFLPSIIFRSSSKLQSIWFMIQFRFNSKYELTINCFIIYSMKSSLLFGEQMPFIRKIILCFYFYSLANDWRYLFLSICQSSSVIGLWSDGDLDFNSISKIWTNNSIFEMHFFKYFSI